MLYRLRDRGERKGQGYYIGLETEGEEGAGISYRFRDRGERKRQVYDIG
jgi:hypothetical protein